MIALAIMQIPERLRSFFGHLIEGIPGRLHRGARLKDRVPDEPETFAVPVEVPVGRRFTVEFRAIPHRPVLVGRVIDAEDHVRIVPVHLVDPSVDHFRILHRVGPENQRTPPFVFDVHVALAALDGIIQAAARGGQRVGACHQLHRGAHHFGHRQPGADLVFHLLDRNAPLAAHVATAARARILVFQMRKADANVVVFPDHLADGDAGTEAGLRVRDRGQRKGLLDRILGFQNHHAPVMESHVGAPPIHGADGPAAEIDRVERARHAGRLPRFIDPLGDKCPVAVVDAGRDQQAFAIQRFLEYVAGTRVTPVEKSREIGFAKLLHELPFPYQRTPAL